MPTTHPTAVSCRSRIDGGNYDTLCQQCRHGAWGDDNSIIVQAESLDSLWARIPEPGAKMEMLPVLRFEGERLLPAGAIIFESAEQARAAAERRLGEVERIRRQGSRIRRRDKRGRRATTWAADLWQDTRIALRTMRAAPWTLTIGHAKKGPAPVSKTKVELVMTVCRSSRTGRASRARCTVAEVAVNCFDVDVSVSCDDPRLLPGIHDRLPPGGRTSQAPPASSYSYSIQLDDDGGKVDGRRFRVGYSGMPPFTRPLRESVALSELESKVRLDVASAATRWLFIHAGVVGRNGRAIVIPAPSRHGKSRLVEALVQAGAQYYSDEFAVLDERGRVHPYAKPLTLRDDGGVETTRRIAVADLGGMVDSEALPIGLVLSTRYRSGYGWRPRRASRAEGVVTMFANAVRARSAPGPLLRTLALALDGALVLDGPRGEAGAVATAVLQHLDDEMTDGLPSGGRDAP